MFHSILNVLLFPNVKLKIPLEISRDIRVEQPVFGERQDLQQKKRKHSSNCVWPGSVRHNAIFRLRFVSSDKMPLKELLQQCSSFSTRDPTGNGQFRRRSQKPFTSRSSSRLTSSRVSSRTKPCIYPRSLTFFLYLTSPCTVFYRINADASKCFRVSARCPL